MLAPRGFCCCWNAPQRRLVARTATRLVLEQYQPLRSVNTSRAGGGVEPEMRVATLAPAVARAVLLLPSPPPRRLRDCVLPSRQRSCRCARELCAAAHTLVSCSWPAPPFGSPRWWVTCFQLQWRDSLVHLAGGLANVFVTTETACELSRRPCLHTWLSRGSALPYATRRTRCARRARSHFCWRRGPAQVQERVLREAT